MGAIGDKVFVNAFASASSVPTEKTHKTLFSFTLKALPAQSREISQYLWLRHLTRVGHCEGSLLLFALASSRNCLFATVRLHCESSSAERSQRLTQVPPEFLLVSIPLWREDRTVAFAISKERGKDAVRCQSLAL